jgi:feruloyl-CoA synthase
MATHRYRKVELGTSTVQARTAENGIAYVKSAQPLQDYPQRMTDRLLHWAEHKPEHTFIAKRDAGGEWRRISYAQALDSARRIGQALLDRSLSAERPVAILSENDLEHAMLALGCQFAGVPFAPISPAYSLVSKDYDKLRHVMEVLTPGMVFVSHGERFASAVRAAVPADAELVVTQAPPADRDATLFAALEHTEPTPAIDAAQAATGPDTIAKFLFTSGSTKLPKAVINTQRMMCANMQMILQCWPFMREEPPVLVDWLVWNHTFGGNKNFNITLYNGGTLYIDDGKPTPQGIGETLRNLREIAPTMYFNVPKGWEEIAHAMETDLELRRNFHSRLRLEFYAAAALPQPIWDKLHAVAEAECGERIVMTTGLGMTETAPSALFVLRDNVRAGEIGTPCPGVEIKLIPSGDKIEVRYRGPSVTPGYWRAPEQTKEVFDDEGFFCSGDAVKWLDAANPDLGFVFDGRVAEDFKLYTGTWVSVGPLRSKVQHEGAPYVHDAVVTGHDRSEVGLLVIPHIELCRKLAGLDTQASHAEVVAAEPVREFFQRMVDRLHAQGTGSANRVTRALLLAEPPSIDRGEITDKGSINQRAVLAHRASLVEALYEGAHPAIIFPSNR